MERYLKDEPHQSPLIPATCSGALRKAESFEMLSSLHHGGAGGGSGSSSALLNGLNLSSPTVDSMAGTPSAGNGSSPMWPWAAIKQEPATDPEEDDEYPDDLDTDPDDARQLLRAHKQTIALR